MNSHPDGNAFEGVIKIIRFNLRFYILSIVLISLIAAALFSHRFTSSIAAILVCAAIITLFWTFSSLFVSWYVYDYSAVTSCNWMRTGLNQNPRRWANIHAGLDETTSHLRALYPKSEYQVIDIYNPVDMTEPSIARARQMHPSTETFTVARAGTLPMADSDVSAVFLLLAAHELRAHHQRVQLLRESARVLEPSGQIILLEHLRNLPNFLAFGPGFMHFHSAQSWRRCTDAAGLRIEQERSVTPFVRCFILRKAAP